ncbi:hypothetical protein BGI41_06980 [Methanobrevibacter sp. 87.7]|uniref:DUF4268 domain-containing protein n=1 Tax=Methanobrevibacter sp. 87.7 TaxID=387957 RepID=UPI000B50B15A|nr:DUF4268 domain-containing protein [Methanobrevibacter sp. 87.7]OWT32571.1 hypothetical protein BGI41_06980 [Methanobrevibacter sp. 87.7]
MQAGIYNFLNFLSLNQQFSIPIFQRNYSWTEKQCKQLFKDILKVSKNDENNHFLGSIVYLKQYSIVVSPISKIMIIDGQQRITTITILIAALTDFLFKNPQDNLSPENLISSYLFNNKEKGSLRYKLVLNDVDEKTLNKIVENLGSNIKLNFNKDDSQRIYKNYEYFRKNINDNNVMNIYKGLHKLLIVYIALDGNDDNPQLIFESLNSTGLELTQSDLIRNYVLMDLDVDNQNYLYKTYWQVIENNFRDKKPKTFDSFIRAYLTTKIGKVPTLRGNDIYNNFKEYSERFNNFEDLVKEIYKYSEYFLNFAFNEEKDNDLRNAFISLNKMGYDVTRPFIMDLYKDYDNDLLDKEEFIELLKYTESYLMRRFICGIESNSLNKTFAKMYEEMMNLNDKYDLNYLNSFKTILLLKDSYKIMPKDNEFMNHFKEADLYNIRTKNRNYLFDKLENFGFEKEPTNIESYTIEHIMPQTLTEEWKEELGSDWEETYKNYLNTIGNLTLTGYNSNLSNKSFKSKQEMKGGFKDSSIRLNKYIRNLNKWNKEEITKRTGRLFKLAKKIWPYPKVDENILHQIKVEHDNRKDKKIPSKSEKLRREYWETLSIELDKGSHNFYPGKISFNSFYILNFKKESCHISLGFTPSFKKIKIQLYIYNSKELFDYLYNQKEQIESELGEKLIWDRRDDKLSSSIFIEKYAYLNNKDNWDKLIKWHIDMADKFSDIFLDRVNEFES